MISFEELRYQLEEMIESWRERSYNCSQQFDTQGMEICGHYIDAYQNVYHTVFGETYP